MVSNSPVVLVVATTLVAETPGDVALRVSLQQVMVRVRFQLPRRVPTAHGVNLQVTPLTHVITSCFCVTKFSKKLSDIPHKGPSDTDPYCRRDQVTWSPPTRDQVTWVPTHKGSSNMVPTPQGTKRHGSPPRKGPSDMHPHSTTDQVT